jgi:hypothetical protein
MRKIIWKLFFITVAVAILVMTLSACNLLGGGESTMPKLTTPKNLQITAKTLTWDAVASAESYTVSIDNAENAADTNSFNLAALTQAKTYQIKVRANGDGTNYTNSNWSSAKAYTVTSSAPVIDGTSNEWDLDVLLSIMMSSENRTVIMSGSEGQMIRKDNDEYSYWDGTANGTPERYYIIDGIGLYYLFDDEIWEWNADIDTFWDDITEGYEVAFYLWLVGEEEQAFTLNESTNELYCAPIECYLRVAYTSDEITVTFYLTSGATTPKYTIVIKDFGSTVVPTPPDVPYDFDDYSDED